MNASRLIRLLAFFALWPCTHLQAQGTWDAILSIDPYPSPYYSDWDANPNIATLTVINTTSSAQDVRIHFSVVDRTNKVVLSGSSARETVGAGATVIFDNPYNVAGSTTHDAETEKIASRTGRLPEGKYNACAVVADASGFALAESCASFTIVYPDPPLLLGPTNGEVVTQVDPLFQWTPVQVPLDYQLTYVMRVVEILQGQTPAEALRSNIPHYQELDGQFPSLRYPIEARPFEIGKRYAWTVQVLDQNGYAAAANDGRSEIWTFAYGEYPPTAIAGDLPVRILFTNADAKDAAPPSALYTDSWEEICTRWDQVLDLSLQIDINGRKYFPPWIDIDDARLVRADTVPGTYGKRQWVIYGVDTDSNDMMLMSGDCGMDNQSTRKRWVGRRAASDAEELANWVPTGTPAEHTEALGKLQFGVQVNSWFEEELGKDALTPVKEFLEHREKLEVKTGINFIGLLDARETALWTVLQLLPFDNGPAEIEIAGFIGANVEVEVELSASSKDGVEAGTEVEADVLVLRGMLPVHRLPYDFFKTLRVGLEITVGVSAEMEHISKPTEVDIGGQIAPKLIVELEDKDGDKWSGEIEVPLAVKRSDGIKRMEVEPTLTLKAEKAWQPWSNLEFEIGHPEIEIKFTKNLSNTDKSSGAEFEATVKGAAILGGEEIGTLGLSIGKAYDSRSEKLVELAEETLAATKAALAKATASNDSAEIAKYTALVAKSDRLIARNKKAEEQEKETLKKSSLSDGYKQPMVGKWYFKGTLGLGDMSITKFLDLIQKIGLAWQQSHP